MNDHLDPEKLKIPAFLRNKAIVRQSKQKLILTALDRKQAGLDVHSRRALAPVKVKEKTYANVKRKPAIRKAKATSFPEGSGVSTRSSMVPVRKTNPASSQFLGDLFRNNPEPKRGKYAKNSQTHQSLLRSILPVDDEPEQSVAPAHQAPTGYVEIYPVGKITAYFEKIEVAVIKLDTSIRLGDILQITADGLLFQQPVDSMQINRKPVKIAKKGAEIGMKVSMKPLINGTVYRVDI